DLSYLSAPIQAYLHLTWNCSMRCKFCFVNAPRKLLRNQLNLGEIKRIISELVEMNVLELTITGGDPLLNPMFIEVAKYAKEKGLVVNATINALLIDEKVANELAKNCIGVQVPLHGPASEIHDELTNTPGSFDKTVQAIKLLVKVGVNITVATTLQKANKDTILDMLPLVKFLGVNSWNITELKPIGRGDFSMTIPLYERLKIIEELEKEAKKNNIRIIAEKPFWFIDGRFKDLCHILATEESHKLFTRCGARVGRYTEITPDGFVYPCDLTLGLRTNIFIAGDLRSQTFKEIWHFSPVLRKIRNIKKEDMHGKCKACSYFDICGGKCRVLAYRYYGDLYAPDPRCPYEPGCISHDS
ncbi:MAG: radical SAM protein, partial [Halobacteria archaeon]